MLNVMEVERFAVHDGPGIRTTVFLKGCALHCPWCANPESQSAGPSLLHDAAKCVGCGACAAVCKTGAALPPPALAQGTPEAGNVEGAAGGQETQAPPRGVLPVLVRAACTGCGACVTACPAQALALCGTSMTAQQVADVCLRDKDYYRESGGGVTLSGGEPLLQAKALAPLLGLLRAQGVSVAVETCGQFPPEALEKILPDIDLFLFDVKHANAQALRAATGADAMLLAGNLDAIVQAGKRVLARVPIIPGFNHTKADMEQIFRYCAAHGVTQAQLLPYHTLGKGKYAKLGLPYALTAPMLQAKDLALYPPLAAACGVTATIGG